MSQSDPTNPQDIQATETPAQATPAEPTPNPAEEESTIGTGTSMALGCIAGTVLLIAFGLLFLLIQTLR